ncbi:MAG: AbrB/MazE/SpoVT family DNA-binding domain-containing protein [Deltaproteobacteria bacterium]|nr:AbrB/MazE/SpoVT family DNA-binding domain-containing protein [Deltaproteobacteria bacterium]
MIEAKIFRSGNSQAIRLPKEYRLKTDSVQLNRIGNVLIIVPKDDPWANFKEGVKEAEDFPEVTDIRPDTRRVKLV